MATMPKIEVDVLNVARVEDLIQWVVDARILLCEFKGVHADGSTWGGLGCPKYEEPDDPEAECYCGAGKTDKKIDELLARKI